MDKLELKHLAKRLPYGMKFKDDNLDEISTLFQINTEDDSFCCIAEDDYEVYYSEEYDMSPILFPLSAITQEITIKGETFTPIEELNRCAKCDNDINFINAIEDDICSIDEKIEVAPYHFIEILIANHFDVDNLIDRNLAISVFDLPQNPYA